MADTPKAIQLTLDALKTCGAEAVLGSVTEPGYIARHSALADAANKSDSTLTCQQQNALRFLAGICSMTLSATKQDEPFGAMIVLHDRRSMLPGDLSSEELDLLATYLTMTSDVWLKGRIAHLLWQSYSPRNYQHSIEAIDNYSAVPLTVESWVRDGDSAWSQAVILAKSLGNAASPKLQRIVSDLSTAALGQLPGAHGMTIFVEPLLREHRLGLDKAADIAIELAQLGELHFSKSEFLDAGSASSVLNGGSQRPIWTVARTRQRFVRLTRTFPKASNARPPTNRATWLQLTGTRTPSALCELFHTPIAMLSKSTIKSAN